MIMDRREFIGGAIAAGAWFTGVLPTAAAERTEDWKKAFASLGFDPSAPGCATFIVLGDPHVPWADKVKGGILGDRSKHLAGRIAEWNAMRPRPLAVLSTGDQISTVTECMGDRQSVKHPEFYAQACADIALFRSYFEKLEMPLYLTLGNHDAFPGETPKANFYLTHYPGWKPYGRYDLGGATLVNLCGGHDGSIEPEQRAWLKREAKTIPDDRALFLMAHYPDVGVDRVDGYDIGIVIRETFSGRTGETWLLAGHNHADGFSRYHLPGGGSLCVATHVREPFGYWIYGLRNGSVVARVLVAFDRKTGVDCLGVRKGPMAVDVKDRGLLPLPFEHEGGKLLWRHMIGSPGDGEFRVSVPENGDAGSYLVYIGKTVYRLPLAAAKGAARVGIYGRMEGNRKTHEPEGLYLSGDGVAWTRIENPWADRRNSCYAVAIPERLRGGSWLYVRVDGFGWGCNSALAGYALLA